MTSTLRLWLADRSQQQLADILRRRPEATQPYPPRSLVELAERLHYPHGLRGVLYGLPLPALELLEALLVFGEGGLSRADLAAVLRIDSQGAGLAATLDTCAQWAVVWEHAGLLHVPGALRTLIPEPMHLGPPVAQLLSQRTADDLRQRVTILKLPAKNRKAEFVAALTAFYADGDAVRKLVATAPPKQRELIEHAALHEPTQHRDSVYLYGYKPDPSVAWLLDHGLIIGDWQTVTVPREVGVALRGPDWHPDFTVDRPSVPAVEVGADAVERDAAAAAAVAIEQFVAVVEACADTPVVPLKTGGIGVREIRRLGKLLKLPEATIRLWLEIAFRGDIIDMDDDGTGLVPTSHYDTWTALPPPGRLGALVAIWFSLRCVPTLDRRPDDVPTPAALVPDSYGTFAADLRADLLGTALDLPHGSGIADMQALAAAVAWSRPIITELMDDVLPSVSAIWAEGHALALLGRGGLSLLGRAALNGADLGEVTPKYVADATREAIFQADLTIVVPGTPATDLTELLDSAADRESRGSAGTWRCTAASVRRALDAGRSADDLLAALRLVAVGHALPQPLEYLISDAARRHGTVRVRAVASIIRADDPALLAEIVATRSLGALQLSTVAPTVLASALPIDRTLAALRAAGFAPVGESADGTTLIERRPARRATRATVMPTDRRQGSIDPRMLDVSDVYHDAIDAGATAEEAMRQAQLVREAILSQLGGGEPAPDPHALAGRLLSGGPEPEPAAPRPRSALPNRIPDQIRRGTRHLSQREQYHLIEAVENGTPIEISYQSQDGKYTERVIEPIEFDGQRIVAWCHLRDDERNFVLSRIGSVTG